VEHPVKKTEKIRGVNRYPAQTGKFCSKDKKSILILLIKKEAKLAVLLRCWKKRAS